MPDKKKISGLSRAAHLLFDEPLAPMTSFHIGGPAEFLVLPACREDIIASVEFAKAKGVPWRALGAGTNVLIDDRGLPGVTVKFWKNFDEIKLEGCLVLALAGAEMLSVSMAAAKNGLTGLEWGSGIPGTVGGAVYMNAGVKDEDISQILVETELLTPDGELISVKTSELSFAYRTSRLQFTNEVVISAQLLLEHGITDEIYTRMNSHLSVRKNSQPINLPNCGSVFRNPPGDFAGRLIEAVGLKGKRIGGMCVSDQHANFIVNCGNGTAQDVKDLIHLIQTTVKEKFNIELKTEMRFIS